jgi:hypothetical protein
MKHSGGEHGSPTWMAYDREYHATEKYLKQARDRRRERLLDQALDTSRDDYDPVRAARLLARWNART